MGSRNLNFLTKKNIHLTTSKMVLVEVERNVRNKLQGYHLDRFFMLVDQIITINQIPSQKLIAEAKQANCDFLVTLDKKHFLTKEASNFLKPKIIITPKIFIELLEK